METKALLTVGVFCSGFSGAKDEAGTRTGPDSGALVLRVFFMTSWTLWHFGVHRQLCPFW